MAAGALMPLGSLRSSQAKGRQSTTQDAWGGWISLQTIRTVGGRHSAATRRKLLDAAITPVREAQKTMYFKKTARAFTVEAFCSDRSGLDVGGEDFEAGSGISSEDEAEDLPPKTVLPTWGKEALPEGPTADADARPRASDHHGGPRSSLATRPSGHSPKEARDAYEVLADEGVERLGFVPGSLPPSPMVISRVVPGSWAEEQGILVGDQFLEVNGIDTAGLSLTELDNLLTGTRPLCLVFCHPEASKRGSRVSWAKDVPVGDITEDLLSEPPEQLGAQVLDGQDIWSPFWGVTRAQCESLLRRLREDQTWDSSGTVHDLVQRVLVPETRGTGLGYALLRNRERPLEANVLVSHAWGENAEELLEMLCRSVDRDDVLFVSALALYFAEDGHGPSVQAQLGHDCSQSPSTKVLEHIRDTGRNGRSPDLWRWQDLLRRVPSWFAVAGLFILYAPIVQHGCVTSLDSRKCSVWRLRPSSDGESVASWSFSARFQDPGAGNMRFNISYVLPVFTSVFALTLWLLLTRSEVYRGRLLLTPGFRVLLNSRLWCVYEIVMAERLEVPTEVAASLAVLGRRKPDYARCFKASDEKELQDWLKLGLEEPHNRVVGDLRSVARRRFLLSAEACLRWASVLVVLRSADLRLLSATAVDLEGEQGFGLFFPAVAGILVGVLAVGLVLHGMVYLSRAAPTLLDILASALLLLMGFAAIIAALVMMGGLRNEGPSDWGDVLDLFVHDCFGYLRLGGGAAGRGCSDGVRFWVGLGQTLGLGGICLLALLPFAGLVDSPGPVGRVLVMLAPALAAAIALLATTAGGQDHSGGEHLLANVLSWITAACARSLAPFLTLWRGATCFGVRVRSRRLRHGPGSDSRPPAGDGGGAA